MEQIELPPPLRRLSTVFWFQYNVILFLGSLLFSAAMRSWGPAVLGALGEAIWLLLGTALRPVYTSIDLHRAKMRRAPSGPHSAALERISGKHAPRFDALVRAADAVQRARLEMGGLSRAELRAVLGRLETLQEAYVRLASVHDRVSEYLKGGPSGQHEPETARLSEALSREKDMSVRLALRQSLTLAQRRVEQRAHIANTLRAVELKMTAIEQSFAYLGSQVIGLGSAVELKAEVDALMAQFSSVGALEVEASRALASAHAG
jgi:hypothetical protein